MDYNFINEQFQGISNNICNVKKEQSKRVDTLQMRKGMQRLDFQWN